MGLMEQLIPIVYEVITNWLAFRMGILHWCFLVSSYWCGGSDQWTNLFLSLLYF